jgi:glucose-1-phosphate cytidylyltransferase
MIHRFFLGCNESLTNAFVMSEGGRTSELMNTDTQDWRIVFVDTGLSSHIGERLLQVRHLLEGEKMFTANDADTLTDLPQDDHIRRVQESGAIGRLLAVRTSTRFHLVQFDDSGWVTNFGGLTDREFWLNARCFNFTPEILDYTEPVKVLVSKPPKRLIGERSSPDPPVHGLLAAGGRLPREYLLRPDGGARRLPKDALARVNRDWLSG